MTRLMIMLLAGMIVAMIYTGWRLRDAESDLGAAQRVIGTLSAGIDSRDKAIARLQQQAADSSRRETQLRLMQGRAAGGALQREITIQGEINANETLRNWSATALPGDVIRLHARPAFSNARDYVDWLSTRGQLSDAGQQPQRSGQSGGR
ncbi:LysB family phage lysis regulatory protein [Erwinia sp. S38]|nr:LysB family phage lysis regulatory protein [Erwinia sp. S38]